jgi:hypothetical protein
MIYSQILDHIIYFPSKNISWKKIVFEISNIIETNMINIELAQVI